VSNRLTRQDLERIDKLSSDYLVALRGMPRVSASTARNLVLDVYATEREFIRAFQRLIDAGLEEKTAKSWVLALNAAQDWEYKNMSSQVIQNFEDEWKSNNLLLATRIMQCIGEWRGLSVEAAWDARLTEYIKNNALSPSPKGSNRAYETGKNPLGPSDDQLNGAQPCLDQSTKPKANPISSKSIAIEHSQKVKSKSDRIWESLATTLGFAIVGSSVYFVNFPKLQGIFFIFFPPDSETSLVGLSDIDASRKVKERLASYHYELANARLVCELDQVARKFRSLKKEALSSYAPTAGTLVEPGLAKALQKISFLKQPGKESYWEDCSIGVGYQKYDQYSWYRNESYHGSLFAVAKRECTKPAIQVITYADARFTKVLYKQWVYFKPDSSTGIASKVKFTVPTSVLPSGNGASVWNIASGVRCN